MKTNKKVVKRKKVTKKSNYTHIIAILDRSGSMSSVKEDAIGGFNTFLDAQKKMKEKATMSVVLFDDQYEPLYNGKEVELKDVNELTTVTYQPRGSTALYDAIGKAVSSYKSTLSTLKKGKPDKVLVITITDGEENASKEYNLEKVNALITEQKANNWQFMFLCSTEDAFKTGVKLGVSTGNTFMFQNTSQGNKNLYRKVSASTVSYRGMSVNDPQFAVKADNLLADD